MFKTIRNWLMCIFAGAILATGTIQGMTFLVKEEIVIVTGSRGGDDYSARGADGYTRAQFKPENLTPREAKIEVRVFQTRKEMQDAVCAIRSAAAGSQAASDCSTLKAANAYYMTSKRCVVFIVDPKVSYEPDQVGHEIFHCWYGEWHSEDFRPTTRASR